MVLVIDAGIGIVLVEYGSGRDGDDSVIVVGCASLL